MFVFRVEGKTVIKPKAPWHATPESINEVDNYILEHPRLYKGIGSRLKRPFVHTSQLKAHDLEILMSQVGIYILMRLDGLGRMQKLCLMKLMLCLQLMTLKVHHRSKLPEHNRRVVRCVSMCESYLPVYFSTINLHMMVHVFEPTGIISMCGPAHSTWMYPMEHFIGQLSKSLRSGKGVAMGIVNYYKIVHLAEAVRMIGDVTFTAPAISGRGSTQMRGERNMMTPVYEQKAATQVVLSMGSNNKRKLTTGQLGALFQFWLIHSIELSKLHDEYKGNSPIIHP